MSTPITSYDFSDIRWQGHWIWVPEDQVEISFGFGSPPGPRQESNGLFRKTFALAEVPARVPVRLTADARFALLGARFVGW